MLKRPNGAIQDTGLATDEGQPPLKKAKVDTADDATTNGATEHKAPNAAPPAQTDSLKKDIAGPVVNNIESKDLKLAQDSKLETSDLPDEALALLTSVFNESEDAELTEDMIEAVYPHGSNEFKFMFSFPTGNRTQYEGYALKFEDKWFLSPIVVSVDVCDKALKEMKRYISEEWDLEEGGTKPLEELSIEHVLWSFEHDEEGLNKQYPIVFRFQNSFLDQELYCGINPQTGELDCCAR